MTRLLPAFLSWFGTFFRSRNDLGLELVALRHQLAVLKRKNPRPRLSRWDRLFWLTLRRPAWREFGNETVWPNKTVPLASVPMQRSYTRRREVNSAEHSHGDAYWQ